MTEFNLSKKIEEYGNPSEGEVIYVKDVKEFIRRLKEEAKLLYGLNGFLTKVDELAGEELSK